MFGYNFGTKPRIGDFIRLNRVFDAEIYKKKYGYSAFGLRIDSEMMLTELMEDSGRVSDVMIQCGDTPERIVAPLEEGDGYQLAEQEFLFYVDGVARYYVANGNKIIVQPCSGANPQECQLFLLGTVMGILLMQRGMLPLHGSAVVANGRCLVFTGDSGAGKSTLAAALRQKGYAILSDDVSALIFDPSGMPWIQPGYPYQKVWQDAASLLNINTKPLTLVSTEYHKYYVPVGQSFWGQAAPLTAVYVLEVKPGVDVGLSVLTGAEKFAALMNHTYRGSFLYGMGSGTDHFQKCATLAKRIPVFRLTRPEGEPSIGKLLEILERHFDDLTEVDAGKANAL